MIYSIYNAKTKNTIGIQPEPPMSRSRLIFIVFYFTAVLITVVHLRTASNKIFYRYRSGYIAQSKLKQQLWKRQLHLQMLKNPDAVSEHTTDNSHGK